MALSTENTDKRLRATALGFSPHIELKPGRQYMLEVYSAGAFVADLQCSGISAENFQDAYLGDTKVTISSAAESLKNPVVVAGAWRLNVTEYGDEEIIVQAWEV